MKTKTIQMQRTVTISEQGEVLYIKCKQTGKVILKLKLIPQSGEHESLLDMCDNLKTGYDWSAKAARQIAAFERGEVQQ